MAHKCIVGVDVSLDVAVHKAFVGVDETYVGVGEAIVAVGPGGRFLAVDDVG